MKSKHKFILTALMSLGLLTLSVPAANAKNIKPASHVSQLHSTKAVSLIKLNPDLVKQNRNNLLSKLQSKNNKGTDSYHRSNQMPVPMSEDNHQAIGNMNHFVHLRKPYRYSKISPNTRDLGGYVTADHKHQVKVDRIIRSADLVDISKAGVNALKQLHVNKIVDLRYPESKNGIQGHPDPNELRSKTLKGTEIVYQKDPVYSWNEAKQFERYMKDHGVHGEYYFYGAPSVTDSRAANAYRMIFKDLLNNHHGAILYHCNLGRDRTGTTSALILSALGVPKDVIYHDYLLTDYYHYNFHRKPYTKQAGELKYFFNNINRKYGNVDNYLRKAVGLGKRDVFKLRKMYLAPNDKRQVTIDSQKSKVDHHKSRGMKK